MPYATGEARIATRPYSSGSSIFVPPEVLEPLGGQLGVPDVLMPEPLLNGPRVVPIVGQLEAAGMARHVRVAGAGDGCPVALTCSAASLNFSIPAPLSGGRKPPRTLARALEAEAGDDPGPGPLIPTALVADRSGPLAAGDRGEPV